MKGINSNAEIMKTKKESTACSTFPSMGRLLKKYCEKLLNIFSSNKNKYLQKNM